MLTESYSQSGFRALNVVYEEESEEEVDDSKELQVRPHAIRAVRFPLTFS